MPTRSQRARQPIALTIAGSDSGGGAGIQADLKTFAALGVHGTSALTCITAQNPAQVTAAEPVTKSMVEAQLAAIWAELPPKATKTGMLYNAANVQTVVDFWISIGRRRTPGSSPQKKAAPLVVDPVMISTSGARLLRPDARAIMENQLLPLATLVTPNVEELAILLGWSVTELGNLPQLRCGARELRSRHGCAVLAKGGHLNTENDATDLFWDGREELLLSAPRVRGLLTHGTGCTYSAAITGYLALGCQLGHAVQLAKNHITQAIFQSVRIGRHTALNPNWK